MQENITRPKAISESFGTRRSQEHNPGGQKPPGKVENSSDSTSLLAYTVPGSLDRLTTFDVVKRAIDVNLSILMIVVGMPVILIVALAIKITSRGPVLYRHRRLGRGGRQFDCWKFRTMVTDADEILRNDEALREEFEARFKIENDPRLTPIGGFLRRTSLDEIPQLMQVLQGQMTLIGPRPIVPHELEKYSIYGPKLLTVKPGLSGMWQTSGRSDTTYAERIHLDMRYIDNRSVKLDAKLLAKTVVTVLKRTGAC